MRPMLVDADVLIDIATRDPRWCDWSLAALRRAGQGARLVINPLIHAEVSLAYRRIEALQAALPEGVFHREPLPWAAGFLAGKAFLNHCRRAGDRRPSWPDLHIGAHAALRGYRLLTRERGRYADWFPRLEIIAPDQGLGDPH
ncbi:PIN domain-containing protein [Paracoccus sp. (in: a-proteobacteria)]|uniref:type II toxin-antitoxin system VapC family toxin n=1 Tax=Paracoccus sp. TaxID=267 RepID=UPI00321F7277